MELATIQNKIYEIRGVKVMIDRDLAELYQVETRALNQAVKRNVDRFPIDFMFQLTDEETSNWKSQLVISKSVTMGLRRNPYAFTELGVAMLSSVLNSRTAIQINISIMRAFVEVRQLLMSPPLTQINELKQEFAQFKDYIEEVFADYNDMHEDNQKSFDEIYYALSQLAANQKKVNDNRARNPIGYVRPKDDDTNEK